MSLAKTQVTIERVEEFLSKRNVSAASIHSIEDGELSRAFYFTGTAGEKVLRINATSSESFIKDQFAAKHFASEVVPVPVIEEIGEFTQPGTYFAISDRASGKTLDTFSKSEINSLMPEIIGVADAIHTIRPMGNGYGRLLPNGNGLYSSCRKL